MIHLIVATTSEAKPLIDYFLLKKKTTIHGYNFYQNEIISLTISGVGKINASISVAHTFFKFNKSLNNIWINIGIAGHKNQKIGTLNLVNKICDNDTKKSYFPFFLEDYNITKKDCITYGKPNFNYNESLSDMEASGFFACAMKYSSKELIHCLKIISDNQNEKINFNNKSEIQKLFEKNLNKLELFIKRIQVIWENFFEKEKITENKVKTQLSKFNYTFTEGVQLTNLLKILYSSGYTEKNILNYSKNIKTNISILKKFLNL